MPPPPVIAAIVGPCFIPVIKEVEKLSVWTVSAHISALRIFRLLLIDPLSVHPFIKGTAVIEYSVQYHPHSPLVHLFYKAGEQFITGLQITNIPCALLILSGKDIVLSARGKHIASVFNNLSVM